MMTSRDMKRSACTATVLFLLLVSWWCTLVRPGFEPREVITTSVQVSLIQPHATSVNTSFRDPPRRPGGVRRHPSVPQFMLDLYRTGTPADVVRSLTPKRMGYTISNTTTMVRGTTRGRRGGGTRRGGVSRAVRNIIRRNRNQPLGRVRATTTHKGRTTATAFINNMRRFVMCPKKIVDKGQTPATDNWWLMGLKWLGSVTLKLLTTALTTETVNQHLSDHPLPDDVVAGVTTGSVITGTIQRLLFGAEDLLGDSDFISVADGDKPAYGRAHYRQARIEWVKVIIQPLPDIENSGGMIAASLLAVDKEQVVDDLKNKADEKLDMHELLRTPGVVYKTARTPTVLTFSPKPSQWAYNWLTLGTQTPVGEAPPNGMEIGGDACLYLTVGYTDMASNKFVEISSQYNPLHAAFEVLVESRIHLREYDEGVVTRAIPWYMASPSNVTIREYSETRNVPTSQLFVHHGVLLERILSLESLQMT